MVAVSGHRRVDIGRLLMIPAVATILFVDASKLGSHEAHGATGALRALGGVLIILFYAITIWCYLRRRPAVATSKSVTAHAAAVAATWLPLTLPLLHGTPPGPGRQGVSDALLIAGTAWAVWSLVSLGRNVSVLAQARSVVSQGPYRWIRHPLYAGELVSALGVAIAMNTVAAGAVWLMLCGLQVYRALREERVLLQALPDYGDYRRRTAALLPGVF
jgi:protein-S-isoprenylcysteine O-methyltransferase Ste14